MRVRRERVEHLLQILVDQTVPREAVVELLVLLRRRQRALGQQVCDLDEVGPFGELIDRVAAVPENALLTVDERDRALARPRVQAARVQRDVARLLPQRFHIDGALSFAAHDDVEFDGLVPEVQYSLFAHGSSYRAER